MARGGNLRDPSHSPTAAREGGNMMHVLLRCPNCYQPLQKNDANDGFICPQNHSFSFNNGILILLSDSFSSKLTTFLKKFEPLRQAEGKRLLDPSIYPSLPFAPEVQSSHEWRMRRYDIASLEKLLARRKRQRILEIGAWNGWLSHWLTKQEHEVTAVDYFIDKYDGLQAMNFYERHWQAIQMDLTDLEVLDGRFDVVILNRCVQFYADPVAYARAAKEKVANDGLLILTGLSFFRDPRAKIKSVAAFQHHLRQQGVPDFQPMKGYLDFEDKRRLQKEDIQVTLVPQLWLANIKSQFKKTAPRYYYGVYKQPQIK
jgi:SAM-dependent methyltransferase